MEVGSAPLTSNDDSTPLRRQEDLGSPHHSALETSSQGSIEQNMQALSVSERESEAWHRTLGDVVRSVVSVRFCQPCAFESSSATASQASGFIVDAENGYILTNRHVVGPGPFWGHIIFSNQEEVDAYPIYRDPIHDFGILRFDPKAVKYMNISALQLRPDLAKVGVEIRVIGNDAGEKLSILSGYISRLDRNAPRYRGYRDFNTCYYQANAAATGGSSGSPVVNVDGYAIALQAGGRTDKASTDFFLPLHAPLNALQRIQRGEAIPRGDIQCKFLLKPFDECRRLGLPFHWEAAVRQAFPKENNMLVADRVLPEGPGDGKIEEGDILIKINGELVAQFTELGDIMDCSIGKTIKVLVQRGGEDIEVDIPVGDLSSYTPDRFLSVAGALFHDMTYQLAMEYSIPCKGVYVSESGLFNIPFRNRCLILSVDYKNTPDLQSFIEVMKDIPDKARVVVSYKQLNDLHTSQTAVITVNRHWSSKMKMVIRNDETGVWDFDVLADPLPAIPPARSRASFGRLTHIQHPAVVDVARCFVKVRSRAPFWMDGIISKNQSTMGVVVNASKGLVLVSRDIVPHTLCEISVTIADTIFVDGKVVFLHPSHNYSIIQYDAELVDAPVQEVTLSNERATQGASTLFVGYFCDNRLYYSPTIITGNAAVSISPLDAPRYRPMNVEGIMIDTSLGDSCDSGVLMTVDGVVQAFWLTYDSDPDENFGLDSSTVLPIISKLRQGEVPKLRILPVELDTVSFLQAREMGVSTEWIEKAEDCSAQRQLYMVKRLFNDQAVHFVEGDVLLTLNNKVIGNAADLEEIYWHEKVDAVVMRQGKEVQMQISTIPDDNIETNRVIHICGAILQRPHRAVRQQIKNLPSEVYVAGRVSGSPASLYGLWTTYFITHINDNPTGCLDTVLAQLRKIPDNTYFRIKGVTYDRTSYVITLKKNERFFPTVEWFKDPSDSSLWRWRTYEGDDVVEGEGKHGLWS